MERKKRKKTLDNLVIISKMMHSIYLFIYLPIYLFMSKARQSSEAQEKCNKTNSSRVHYIYQYIAYLPYIRYKMGLLTQRTYLKTKMADSGCTKLLVRHLPFQLNVNDKTDLLKHFGAKDVVCMERRGKMVGILFVQLN